MTEIEIGPIGQMMKDGCWDLHQSAESGMIAKKLISGEIGRAEYTELVKQMYLFNRRLDESIRSHRSQTPALRNLIHDEQLQTPYYERDLEHFAIDPSSAEPTPGTAAAIRLIDRVEAEKPQNLLALHYVREGANNGNRFVARKLMQAWAVEGKAGFEHLDPYGESQRSKWDAFKTTLNEQPFSDDEKRELVRTGRSMFEAVIAIHRDVESVA